ncbi:CDP-6-deoxy-delta-3,4-glucoseen reductase [Ralstonia flatus]|uniref:CDP-6-deoxy-L-threo-D-glycero-4-hexulose-3-dehydrase reductase n=1 Tax=Ralstonia flatus TaxID=3058601 RepID=A0AAD2BV92_9RALS|nr:CDP-6-deoxy-delta-3,4-glucoseen reductase [Ralstonia sp. LMG 32965]MBN6210616.1 CDP-6-deoxy-delta-3,4-glucoseen reductase [Ralstonia pickettii]CAJ0849882.1 CDP-6-deoxy-L-threo-D-glycero-4-hexulose-3-dehydrase reductase [Ralstonia sp. LMG 32965]CAJ0856324.1 CDP-6-deoxy-L-threo-D-glycero-4-hexulose-3-dehydrase reductase [Ralstonia sp. LMG 32965]
MAYQINVLPSGRQFQAEDGETILAAALRQGIGLPYGCKNGACGSCKGQVREGSIVQGNHSPNALTAQEATEGRALFCCATPATNVTIEVREVHGAGDVPIKKIPCRVASLEKAAPDVTIVKLQLPATERMQFLAGQYVEFLLRDGKRRSYSIANPPHDDGPIELHIRHMPGGAFTDYVFGAKEGAPAMKERDILRFEGPLGSFFLREESDKPIILLASGTGFAPIKAIVEHAQFIGSTRPMTLYWGGRRPQDLYMHAKAEEWARTLPNFTYVPVVSNALPEDAWTGRTGFVHQAVMADYPDLSGHEVYACGAPVVINSARTDFAAQCGMHPDAFFADSFTSEADLHPAG